MVFVVPEPVGPEALFIDKIFAFAHVGDLGEPARPQARQQPDAILDHLTGEHPWRNLADDLETQPRRCERVEVARRGEKFPDERGRGRDKLLAVELADHGGDENQSEPRRKGWGGVWRIFT